MPDPTAAASKRRTLLYRTISTTILVALISVALWLGKPFFFLILFGILSMGGLIEYFSLFPTAGYRRYRWLAFGVGSAYLVLLYAPLWGYDASTILSLDSLALAILTILMFLVRLRAPLEGFRSFDEIAATLFGFAYCVILFSFVPKILLLPLTNTAGEPASVVYLVYLVTVTKLTDIGAYLVGSAIGRDKLVPHISPGKTWQGFWGALTIAMIGSYVFWYVAGDQIPAISALDAGILGLLLPLVAVLGDLAESIMKRSLAVKDSGHVMPGIGGFLDLIDSVIFTAPVFYLYLVLFT